MARENVHLVTELWAGQSLFPFPPALVLATKNFGLLNGLTDVRHVVGDESFV